MSQKKQQAAGCGCLAIVMLIVIGAIGNACSSPSTPASQAVSPIPTVAVSSPSASATVTPSPVHTRHHRAAVTHPPARTHRPSHRPVRRPKPAPAPRPTCHPRTSSGKCYEPGEFCRNSDHGVRGVAGNGEKIRCENNNGWRWERI